MGASNKLLARALAAPQVIQRVALRLNCGHCGGDLFTGRIVPHDGKGRLAQLVCTRCKKPYAVDDDGCIVGAGRIDLKPGA